MDAWLNSLAAEVSQHIRPPEGDAGLSCALVLQQAAVFLRVAPLPSARPWTRPPVCPPTCWLAISGPAPPRNSAVKLLPLNTVGCFFAAFISPTMIVPRVPYGACLFFFFLSLPARLLVMKQVWKHCIYNGFGTSHSQDVSFLLKPSSAPLVLFRFPAGWFSCSRATRVWLWSWIEEKLREKTFISRPSQAEGCGGRGSFLKFFFFCRLEKKKKIYGAREVSLIWSEAKLFRLKIWMFASPSCSTFVHPFNAIKRIAFNYEKKNESRQHKIIGIQ